MSPTALLRLTSRTLRSHPSFTFRNQLHHSQSSIRPFSTTLRTLYPRKGAEDKDSIDRRSTEYTRSGTDDDAAEDPEAFDPSTTEPKSERDEATTDGNSNLDVSPANPDVSKQRDTTEGGAEKSGKDQNKPTSGHGGPQKGKEI